MVEVEGDSGFANTDGAQCVHGQAMPDQQMVGRGERGCSFGGSWGVMAVRVPEERTAPGLVERDPPGHAIGELLGDDVRVRGEALSGVPASPPAGVFERLRKVPVIEGDCGLDAGLQQVVHEA